MDIAKPLLRLLLACLLLILSPIYLGMNRLPVAWLVLPGGVLSFISCSMQGYRRADLVALCAASVFATVGGIYVLSYAAAGLL